MGSGPVGQNLMSSGQCWDHYQREEESQEEEESRLRSRELFLECITTAVR